VSEAFKALVAQMGIEEMRCNASYLKAEIATRPKVKQPPDVGPTAREQQVLAAYSSLRFARAHDRAERERLAEKRDALAEGLRFRVNGTTRAWALLERQAKRYIAAAVKSGRRPRRPKREPLLSTEEVLRRVALAREEDEQGSGAIGE
jgi:hypothetical protein